MRHHHGWTLEELEGIPPFERMIYVELLMKHLRELEEKRSRQGG